MKPFFRYPGSKWRLTPLYEPLWPPHTHFVDVFGGSGAVILNKHRSKIETFNDIDPSIFNLFRIVRDGQLDDLKRMIQNTPHRSRRAFEEALAIVQQPDPDPVKSAWAWLYLTDNSLAAKGPAVAASSNWAFARTTIRRRHWEDILARIDMVHSRFRNVQLTNWNWDRIISGKQRRSSGLDSPSTLFFMDPSYYPPTLGTEGKLYAYTMSVQDHRQMLRRLQRIQGFVFLCGYPHEDYDNALAGWHTRTFSASTNMHMRGEAKTVIEKVWMNYDPATGEKV